MIILEKHRFWVILMLQQMRVKMKSYFLNCPVHLSKFHEIPTNSHNFLEGCLSLCFTSLMNQEMVNDKNGMVGASLNLCFWWEAVCWPHVSRVALQDSPNKSGGLLSCLPLNVHFALRSCTDDDRPSASSFHFKRIYH